MSMVLEAKEKFEYAGDAAYGSSGHLKYYIYAHVMVILVIFILGNMMMVLL